MDHEQSTTVHVKHFRGSGPRVYRVDYVSSGVIVEELKAPLEEVLRDPDPDSNRYWVLMTYEETQSLLHLLALQALGFITSTVKVVPELRSLAQEGDRET